MATNSSKKVLTVDDLGAFEQWQPPPLSGPAQARFAEEVAVPQLPTAAQIEAIQKQAWQEGYDRGRQEGFDFGHKESLEEGRGQLLERLERFDGLMRSLDRPFEALDEQVEQELLSLAVSMVRQLMRREIRADPHQIVGVVREALSILPASSRNIRVVLHPEDAELVRVAYGIGERAPSWEIVEDPVIARGGCKVSSDTSRIDATLENRLSNLIAPLLGGERVDDRPETGA